MAKYFDLRRNVDFIKQWLFVSQQGERGVGQRFFLLKNCIFTLEKVPQFWAKKCVI
jgi:hypothetical protein